MQVTYCFLENPRLYSLQDYLLPPCDAASGSSKSKTGETVMGKRSKKHKLTVKGAHLGMKHKEKKGRKKGGRRKR